MSDRSITCDECGKGLGVIRDAKLRKGMVHICGDCKTKFAALKSKLSFQGTAPNGENFGDIFGDVFGSRR